MKRRPIDDQAGGKMKIEYHPIGIIRSPFKHLEGMPIQPAAASSILGRVEVFPEYAEGLKDLDGFSHIILLYHLHRVKESNLIVTPFLDSHPRGVFSTRAPKRPNPIGISVVKLLRIDGAELHIENVDILNGTPLLDIKPYVPQFDPYPVERIGWLEQAQDKIQKMKSDDRFT
jgi:tRNA-Thr(GGU) m(6)t(6)A37 methyltransferase TsaA